MNGRRFRAGVFAACGALVALSAGCGKPATAGPASVRGAVSFHGHPLTGGLIVFVPDADRGTGGKLFTANVGTDGVYQLANGEKVIPPGWYRVAIADPPEWYGLETNGTAFPAALRRPDKSGIEREVKGGVENVFDFPIVLTE